MSTTKMAAGSAGSGSSSSSGSGRAAARGTSRKKRQGQLSDDEILGIVTTVLRPETSDMSGDSGDGSEDNGDGANLPGNAAAQYGGPASGESNSDGAESVAGVSSAEDMMTPEIAKVVEANPQLQQVLADAQAYRAVFASPAAAQDAKNQLDELDGMFFSRQPADHAALAARMHELSPEAFQNFAKA
ncbi:MAG: hypothetical protein ACRD33_11000, partial [Candidatus Acidiferrales bacterium]